MRAAVFALLILLAPLARAQPVITVTQLAEQADGLSRPHDAAFSPDGKQLYVTDMQNSRIRAFDAMTLAPLATFGEGELSYPHDAEFDQAGRLLVADTGNDRIAIYAPQDGTMKLVGELAGLAAPEGVAVMADGRVLATNTRDGTLSVFRDGRLERRIGRRGGGQGEFSNPHDIEVAPEGLVYVVDSGNNRVQVLDAEFSPHAGFGAEFDLNGPKYLSFDADRIWLADEYNHRILLLDRAHRLLGVLGSGRRGRGPDAFYQPEAVLARAPYLWVIDTYNDRIVKLRVE